MLYHPEFDFLWLFMRLRPRKKCPQIPCIILSFNGNIIWTYSVGFVRSLSAAFLSFAKKVAINFCQFSLSYWRYCSHWIYEIKSGGHWARLREKEFLSRYRAYRSLREISYNLYARAWWRKIDFPWISEPKLISPGFLSCVHCNVYNLYAHAHVRVLMTQKSCAVWMRNARLGNHLNSQ